MSLNTAGYLIKDAFSGMHKDLKNTLISLGTMFATMLLIAVAYLVYMNENKFIDDTKDRSSNIVAYIDINVSDEDAVKLGYEVENIAGITSNTYRDKSYAVNLAKSMNPIMVEGFSDDVLRTIYPAYFVITFDDVDMVETIVHHLAKIPGIEEISVNQYAREKARNAEIYKDVYAISVCDAKDVDSPTTVGAQAANELLTVKDIKASFVLTPYNDQVYISARSMDKNVQVLMEEFGGGGHMTLAGAQVKGAKVEDVVKQLKKLITAKIKEGEL